jgi:glycosyltransferase involved in cell wall biosynthesis
MRIAIFSDNFYPELSGISDSIIGLAKELAKRGHFINFYAPRYSPSDYEKVNLLFQEINLGKNIGITRFSSFHFGAGTGQARGVIPLPWRWRQVKKFKPDIIHTQLFFGVGLEALIAGKKLGVPLVGTNHTAVKEYLRYSPIKAGWFQNLVMRYVNWYYGKCILTTAPSRSVIEEMRQYGFRGESHVISNPIDTETFCPLPNKNWLRKKFGFTDATVIHAGRLAAERNIDVIIKAMPDVLKKIPTAQLALVGRGVAEKDLELLAKKLGVANSVKFLGFLEKPALAEAYNASKIFVITSTSDTQSMVMMQAMASGLPIIGVKARALPEYINSKNGILIEPGDEKTLAKKIILLLKETALRKKLALGARNFANKFSAPEVAKEWEEIYGKVIKDYNNDK